MYWRSFGDSSTTDGGGGGVGLNKPERQLPMAMEIEMAVKMAVIMRNVMPCVRPTILEFAGPVVVAPIPSIKM